MNFSSLLLTMQEDPVLLESFRWFENDDDIRTMMITPSSSSSSPSPSSSSPSIYSSSTNKSPGLFSVAADDDHDVLIFSDDDDNDDNIMKALEPTPIDPSSAIFVDKLPLNQITLLPLLLSKQDAENYDFFLKTFSSCLVTAPTTIPSTTTTFTTKTGDDDDDPKEEEVTVPNIHIPAFKYNYVESTSNTSVRPSMLSFLQNDIQLLPCTSPTTTWTTPMVPVSRVMDWAKDGGGMMTLMTTHLPQQEQEQKLDQELEELDLELQRQEEEDGLEYDDTSAAEDDILPLNQASSSSSSYCSPPSLSSSSASITTSTATTSSCNGSSSGSTVIITSPVAHHHHHHHHPNVNMHIVLWNRRYQELIEFQRAFGHCLVPLHWPMNPQLGHWVKRQRYQYRIKHQKAGSRNNRREQRSSSALTDERQAALEQLGFTWDSHASHWEERLNELRQFQEIHGHTNLPKKCKEYPQLPIWAKCQRRQYKLFQQGKKSRMTQERIEKLVSLGFCLDPMLKTSTKTTTTTTKRKRK